MVLEQRALGRRLASYPFEKGGEFNNLVYSGAEYISFFSGELTLGE